MSSCIDILNILILIKENTISNILIKYNLLYFICDKYTKNIFIQNKNLLFNKYDIILLIKHIKVRIEFNRLKFIKSEHYNPYYDNYFEPSNMIENKTIYYLTIEDIKYRIYSKYRLFCTNCKSAIFNIYNDRHPNYYNNTLYCNKCKLDTRYDKGLYIIKYSNVICILCGEYVAYSIKKTTNKIPPHCKCYYQRAMYL